MADAIPARRRSPVLIARRTSRYDQADPGPTGLALEHALFGVPHVSGVPWPWLLRRAAGHHRHRPQRVRPARTSGDRRPVGQLGVAVDEPSVADAVRRDGEVRAMWDATPLDLFFSYDAFHDAAGAARQPVPFGDETISILAAEHLAVCKAIFDRPKDWVDIDAMLAAGSEIDAAEVLRWVARSPATRAPATTGWPRCSPGAERVGCPARPRWRLSSPGMRAPARGPIGFRPRARGDHGRSVGE